MTTTSLEHMPNELLLLCMSFLGPIDVYRALAGLNYRFNSLLSVMISVARSSRFSRKVLEF